MNTVLPEGDRPSFDGDSEVSVRWPMLVDRWIGQAYE